MNAAVLQRYVAFLRAINVGGHTVKMAELRRMFESVGLDNVETFIASGNVIFESTAKTDRVFEEKIEAHLEKRLGYAVGTYVRSIPELRAIAEYRPFKVSEFDVECGSLYVGFLAQPPPRDAARQVTALRTKDEGFAVHGREFYWFSRTGFAESAFAGKPLDKALGMSTTVRNIKTVRRLVAKYGPGAKMRA